MPKSANALSTKKWFALDAISTQYEPAMRLAFTKALTNPPPYSVKIQPVLANILTATCRYAADFYGLEFNPFNPVYRDTVTNLCNGIDKTLDNSAAQHAVSLIVPPGLPALERRRRIAQANGLDPRMAVAIEQMHQRAKTSTEKSALRSKTMSAIQTRSNLLAITETNRAVNQSLLALWRANEDVRKAQEDVTFYDQTIKDAGRIPRNARKVILTRRDDRVCTYCDVLDGVSAKLNDDFDTEYGMFECPPFHPRCRCFMLVTTEY